MKRFRFRLETLLKFRKLQEEQAQLRLAKAEDVLRRERERLTVLEQNQTVNTDILRQCQQEGSTVEILKLYQVYLDKIKRDISAQKSVIAKAEQQRQECLKALEEAMKKRKLVENLKERRRLQHELEELSEEQKLLDEMGIQLFIREK
ncbi:MAG TPA: flagellar export protein FliJ [Patescibacteria group bacterium]|nr:flagellar export protein FliJ [Patescibacteria group bacterium]